MSKRRGSQTRPVAEPVSEDPPPTAAPRAESLTRELVRVEEAVRAFYDAFHTRDVEAMANLWSRSPYARCVHPGWEPVVGWPAIRQSWAEIFESMDSIEFELDDVHVEVSGPSAWVNLIATAEVSAEDEEPFATAVVATTVLEKVDDDWTIILHHSSHFADDDELDDEDEDDEDFEGFGGGFEPN